MSRAMTLRALRDTRTLLLLLIGVLISFEILFVFVIGRLSEQLLQFWQQMPIVSQLLRALVGIDPGRDVSFSVLLAINFVHPFLLAVLWIFLVTVCSRDIVGEIDRGTADVLLTLPTSRSAIYVSVSGVWFAAIVALVAAAWLGLWMAGQLIETPEPVRAWQYWRPLFCLLWLSVAIGCATMCVSSFTSRRGHAIAVVLGALLFSFLLNFLAAFVPVFEPICIAGVLYYYRPVDVVREARLPIGDLAVLIGSAALLWSVGLWRFTHRDIPAA